MSNIFITGGTGFLGSMLASEILTHTDDCIFMLVRGNSKEEAQQRANSVLQDILGENIYTSVKHDRIRVFRGDVSAENLGLEKSDERFLVQNIDTIYHCAALTNFNLLLDVARKTNVEGTKNILEFALKGMRNNILRKVNYVSTAYVVGNKSCVFYETDLNVGQGFNNTYEQSKYEAEELIANYRNMGVDIDIFRPSTILGRYSDGKTTNFKMFYQPLHFFSLELIDKIPFFPEGSVNMINVDVLARAILKIDKFSNKKSNMNYHMVSPEGVLLADILDIASDFFAFKKPRFIPREEFNFMNDYTFIQRTMMGTYMPYWSSSVVFRMDNSLNSLEVSHFRFPEFDKDNLIRLFKYCEKTGFIKRKDK